MFHCRNSPTEPIYTSYHEHPEELSFIDEWGVGHKRGSTAHFTHFFSPMADFTTPEEVEAYPFPDMLSENRWKVVREQVEKTHKEGRAAAFLLCRYLNLHGIYAGWTIC